jgi:hypothetical protein
MQRADMQPFNSHKEARYPHQAGGVHRRARALGSSHRGTERTALCHTPRAYALSRVETRCSPRRPLSFAAAASQQCCCTQLRVALPVTDSWGLFFFHGKWVKNHSKSPPPPKKPNIPPPLPTSHRSRRSRCHRHIQCRPPPKSLNLLIFSTHDLKERLSLPFLFF